MYVKLHTVSYLSLQLIQQTTDGNVISMTEKCLLATAIMYGGREGSPTAALKSHAASIKSARQV